MGEFRNKKAENNKKVLNILVLGAFLFQKMHERSAVLKSQHHHLQPLSLLKRREELNALLIYMSVWQCLSGHAII